MDNVLLVLEEMSWVLYFVHPCASGIQNRLYKIAPVLYTPAESNMSSLVLSLCHGPLVSISTPDSSALRTLAMKLTTSVSPQENSTNPVRGKKKVKPQKQGVKRNTKIDVCRFSMLFWLLKYQEWSWGGGVFGDFCFVLFFGSGGKKNHSGPCVWPPPQGGSCAVASLQHRGSVHTAWPPCSTSVLLRPDTRESCCSRSSFC